jgi:hypothetical protein
MPKTPKSTPALAGEDMMFFSKIVVSTIADSKAVDNITQDDSDLLGVMTRIFILNLDGITPTSEVVMKSCGIPPSKLKRIYDQLSKKNLLRRLDTPPLKGKGRMFVYDFTPELLNRIVKLKVAAEAKKR